jgi:SEC-C motif
LVVIEKDADLGRRPRDVALCTFVKPLHVTPPRRLGHLQRDRRGYPIIAVVSREGSDVDFGALSERRKVALATFDWCSVCGLPFGTEPRWHALSPEMLTSTHRVRLNEAPSHEICLMYAAQVCPFLSSSLSRMSEGRRAGQRRWTRVMAAGFTATDTVTAKESVVQPGTHVLHFDHNMIVDRVVYTHPEEVADRYARLLASETMPEMGNAEQDLVALFNDPDDQGHYVCGGAVMAGAAFAPNIFRVQTMAAYDRDGYRQMAAAMLQGEDEFRRIMAEHRDPATRATAGWLMERITTMPAVLSTWRARGRGRSIPTMRTPEGPGRTVPKNASCPCGSGRKAGRCHPGGVATHAADVDA